VSSQPTSFFAHELPFSVANAGRPTSFSIEALYTSIGGTPCKNFPLSVVRLYDELSFQTNRSRSTVHDMIAAAAHSLIEIIGCMFLLIQLAQERKQNKKSFKHYIFCYNNLLDGLNYLDALFYSFQMHPS
jgi:hypothetical protein